MTGCLFDTRGRLCFIKPQRAIQEIPRTAVTPTQLVPISASPWGT